MKKLLPKLIGYSFNILTLFFPKFAREKCFQLLCRVKRIPINKEGQEFFDRAETQYFTIAGKKVALHKWGSGPKTIFFMHGWMSHSQRWKVYVESLDWTEYSCYALDAPGHGASEGNFFNLEIYRRAFKKSIKICGHIDVLVSHSLGGLVAAYDYLYNEKIIVSNYVIMGAPSGMLAIFDYFKTTLGLSSMMERNLKIKINEVLQLPPEEISLINFFRKTNEPILMIHEESDKITPVGPMIMAAYEGSTVRSFYTQGLNHTLKSNEVINLVTSFIQEQTTKKYVSERV